MNRQDKGKVPAATAIATSTKETHPIDIIPEKEEIVKTPHLDFFNGAEEEAVINAVADKLDEYNKKISELTKSIEIYRNRRDTLCRLLKRNGYKDVITLICKEDTE